MNTTITQVDPRRSRIRIIMMVLWGILMALGLIGLYQRLTQGHLPAGYGSYVPWGLWVAFYFHGVGIAGGAFLWGALGYIRNWEGSRRRENVRTMIILSLASIFPAFMGVWLDLGHMERSHFIFTSPSFTSMMAFNAWMYTIFILVAAVAWILSYQRDSRWLKPFLFLGILLSIVFPSQSGAFFGVVDARPFWHSPLLPILFLTSALTSGGAMLLVMRALQHANRKKPEIALRQEDAAAIVRLRYFLIRLMVFYFILEFAEFSVSLWNPMSHAPALELILFGPYWWVFWIIHLLLGGIVPIFLLLRKPTSGWIVAAVLITITFVSTRLNVLIPGQAVGEIQGLQQAFQHPRLSYIYHATLMEYMVGCLLVAVGVMIYVAGNRISHWVAAKIGA